MLLDTTLVKSRKAVEYAKSRAEFTPIFMKVDELAIGLKAVNDLPQLYQEVDQLCKDLNDTIMQLGSKAYAEVLAYYNSVE